MNPPPTPPQREPRSDTDQAVPLLKSAAVIVLSFLAGIALLVGTFRPAPAVAPIRSAARPPAPAAAPAQSAVAEPSAPQADTSAPAATGGVAAAATAAEFKGALPVATPFQLIPSPVRASAIFTLDPARTCPGLPTRTSDVLTFTTSNGLLTIRQPSTGGTSTGPIDTSGAFTVTGAATHETYSGHITGLSATADNVLETGGCSALYRVALRFLVGG